MNFKRHAASGFLVLSFLGGLVLFSGRVMAQCPDQGCEPFTTQLRTSFFQDSVFSYLKLLPPKPRTLKLLPLDTGMTWEYRFMSSESNRGVSQSQDFLYRFRLLGSKDSGSYWVSHWKYGYQGTRFFSFISSTVTEVPWTEFDTVLACAKDSGLDWNFFNPRYMPGQVRRMVVQPFMRPNANDSFAAGGCCARPISNGQSSDSVFAVSRLDVPSGQRQTSIYQANRGLLFTSMDAIAPDFSLSMRASLSFYGRNPAPVPVIPRRHERFHTVVRRPRVHSWRDRFSKGQLIGRHDVTDRWH